ncbi:amino acid permease/ SLC12A domain-containing protein [Phakopsora pachyrhizi]|uniref:Amino acid permease/ SLC12A domain-containing protein n=1 Tax=Phakopsora pachyrhizi TaxID=170000 RepID=A0AAV0ARI5_PHAPC|nr:amino acid permease/ SLC12A domain-containing protein [Phakopsora pachyrhizi]CAH7671009.1 amino acid permease/ SLC12A domain-containing protein [Phakopsora pachyrhizi]
MKKKLKQRHLSMMAIGGTIGTGLFLGMGSSLNAGGPVGLLIGYILMGTVVYGVQCTLGEMVTMYPVSGPLAHFATRFVDPALGFAVGWNYWYSFSICIGAETKAATIIVQYWKMPVHAGVWITLFLTTSCSINFFGVRFYGEVGGLTGIKILSVVVLLIIGIVLDVGGGPSHERIGLKYWKDPGPFRQFNDIVGPTGKFLALWSVFTQAAYSFIGTETVALAAAEASNPRKSVPKALSSVFYRILFFYVLSALVIGLLVPYNDPRLLNGTGDASSSPFVIAINRAGIKILPDIINTFILISAYSAASSQLYSGTRVLHGLAMENMAPKILKRCTKSGVPLPATLFTLVPGLLAYMNLSHKAGACFNWLVNLSAMSGLLTWWAICFSHIRFQKAMKAQDVSRESLPFVGPLQPYMTYYTFIALTLIIITNGFHTFWPNNWSWSSFIAAYITLPIFIGSYAFWLVIL